MFVNISAEAETYLESKFLVCTSFEYITALMKKTTSLEFEYSMIDLANTLGVNLSNPLDSYKIGTDVKQYS